MCDIRLPAGFVASMNQTTTQFFSTSRQEDRGQEFSSSLQNMMTAGQYTRVTYVLNTCYISIIHVSFVCFVPKVKQNEANTSYTRCTKTNTKMLIVTVTMVTDSNSSSDALHGKEQQVTRQDNSV